MSELRSSPYFKVLVTGDRLWSDYEIIEQTFRQLIVEHPDRQIMVIHGKAAGADSLAGLAAWQLGLAVHAYPAEWTRYGRAAGPKRNQLMITENPDISLALVIHDHLERSRGTKDCLHRIERAKIPTLFIKH